MHSWHISAVAMKVRVIKSVQVITFLHVQNGLQQNLREVCTSQPLSLDILNVYSYGIVFRVQHGHEHDKTTGNKKLKI